MIKHKQLYRQNGGFPNFEEMKSLYPEYQHFYFLDDYNGYRAILASDEGLILERDFDSFVLVEKEFDICRYEHKDDKHFGAVIRYGYTAVLYFDNIQDAQNFIKILNPQLVPQWMEGVKSYKVEAYFVDKIGAAITYKTIYTCDAPKLLNGLRRDKSSLWYYTPKDILDLVLKY
jgi:hypothetical protein